METIRSGCPVNAAAEVLVDAWSLLILRDLMLGQPMRFGEIAANSLEGISRSILSNRLHQLVDRGLVMKARVSARQGSTYSLTEAGIEVLPILVALGNWGIKHRETTPLLRVRTDVLRRGGAAFVEAMMDELREAYLGVPRPDPDAPRPTNLLKAAYLEASQRLQEDVPAIDQATDTPSASPGAAGAGYVIVPIALPSEADLAGAAEWAIHHLSEGIGVTDLAAAAHLSERQLRRRFMDAFGCTPGEWLVKERVRVAQHLLESTDLPIDEVAAQVGFASAAGLRSAFARHVRLSPGAYREAGRRSPADDVEDRRQFALTGR